MNYFLASLPPLLPLLILFLPGLAIASWPTKLTNLMPYLARAVLWSISLTSLLSLATITFGLPPAFSFFFILPLAIYFLYRQACHFTRPFFFMLVTSSLIFLAIFAFFSLPFLLFHNGLPTGDSQKAIFWANYIISHHSLPNYSISQSLLNRDPVDFYTPALHAFTATVMQLTPNLTDTTDYMAIGFLSIGVALALVLIAIAIAQAATNNPKHLPWLILLVPAFLLTQTRFLRYLREPGYHFQNIIGELLLFGTLYLAISLLSKTNKLNKFDLSLFVLVLLTLVLSHQFSTFLFAFVFLPFPLYVFVKHRHSLQTYLSTHLPFTLFLLCLSGAFFFLFIALGLHHKLPHLFTATPHLISLTPLLPDYFRLMGTAWLLTGLLGLLFLWRRASLPSTKLLASVATIIILLSQAPRLFIDIPPVRALFYLAVPFSITAAFAIIYLAQWAVRPQKTPKVFSITTLLLVIITVTSFQIISLKQSFVLSHNVRTNSTLQADHLPLIKQAQLSPPSDAILIDDYNRRSASWFILSGHPTFSRISSDLARQMNEAKQSPARYSLYLKQLDFEKIFSLGSLPAIDPLLKKYNISFLTGIAKSSNYAFARNPLLLPIGQGGDLFLYHHQSSSAAKNSSNNAPSYTQWLLRPTTLANDIGDNEDTFLHSPASLRATRLSPPQNKGHTTWRTTTAPFIPLSFNVGDYVKALWDQDHNEYPDTSVSLLLLTAGQTKPFTVITPTQDTIEVPTDGRLVNIPASQLFLGNNKLITLTIYNPKQLPVNIDLIALGLSRVP